MHLPSTAAAFDLTLESPIAGIHRGGSNLTRFALLSSSLLRMTAGRVRSSAMLATESMLAVLSARMRLYAGRTSLAVRCGDLSILTALGFKRVGGVWDSTIIVRLDR